jgi:hypothetical protein
MKKIIIFLSLFFYIGIASALAIPSCPEGSTPLTNVQLNIGGCTYIVELCFKCGDAMNAGWVSIWSYTKKIQTCDPGPGWTEEQILNEIKNQVSGEPFIRAQCGGNIPPCPDGIQFMVLTPDCWRKYYLPGWGIVNEPCLNFDFITCSFRICWLNGSYVKQDVYTSHPSNYSCPALQEYQVPDPTIPGETSDCFSVIVPCP